MGLLVLGGVSAAACGGLASSWRCAGANRRGRRAEAGGAAAGLGGEAGAGGGCHGAPAASSSSSGPGVVDVVVIGGGFAGLACATALRDAGLTCCVLEASGRPGGRAQSRPAASGQGVVELGAEFIHGERVATWRYLQRFGLAGCSRGCSATPGRSTLEEGGNYVFLNGELLQPERVHGERGGLFFGRVEAAGERWIQDGGDPSISVGELVRRREADIFGGAGAPPAEEERRLCHGMMAEWYAADLDEVSLLEDLPEQTAREAMLSEPGLQEEDGEEGHWRVRDGYSALAERMADGVPMRYSHKVVKVEWSCAGGVCVTTRAPAGPKVFGHAAVVTLPLACLKDSTVAFEPALPEAKLRAVQELGAGRCCKVVLTFERSFWPQDLQFLFTPFSVQVWWPGPPGEPCLVGYTGGARDLRLFDGSDAEVCAEARRQLEKIFVATGRQAKLPDISMCQVVRWHKDPWARMGYSFHAVGCPADARLRLREPCWPLLWAGEACHPTRSALVHGALETGEHAAGLAAGRLGVGVVDLREAEQDLLDQVYEELLQTNFPVEAELDDLEVMRSGLRGGLDGRNPELHILVAKDRGSGQLAGCCYYEYYPSADCGLMSYLCVGTAHRRRGVSQRLVRHMELQLLARTGGRPVAGIFAETHAASVDDGVMDPLERQEVLSALGFRCLDFDYVQPPLTRQQEPCGGLRLLVKDRDSLPTEVVVAYLDGFAGSVTDWDDSWKQEPYYKAQVAQLAGRPSVAATCTRPW